MPRGSPQWGHGHRAGLVKGRTQGIIIGLAFPLALSAISAIGYHISTRKLKAEKIITKKK